MGLQLMTQKYVYVICKLLFKIVNWRSWRERREAIGVTKKSALVWAYNAFCIISPQDFLSANSTQCYSEQVR